jgi:hypothetical protein
MACRIVPDCYRKHFPTYMKSHRSHDIVLPCMDCHMAAHTSAEHLKRAFAVRFDVPLYPTGVNSDIAQRRASHAAAAACTSLEHAISRGSLTGAADAPPQRENSRVLRPARSSASICDAPAALPAPSAIERSDSRAALAALCGDVSTGAELCDLGSDGGSDRRNGRDAGSGSDSGAPADEACIPNSERRFGSGGIGDGAVEAVGAADARNSRLPAPLTARKAALVLECEPRLPAERRCTLERLILTCAPR